MNRNTNMKYTTINNIFRRAAAIFLAVMLAFSGWPMAFQPVEAAGGKIRQEINIIDGYRYAATGAYATSSAIISIDPSRYTGATYYLEVVASTTAATNATISIANASSSALLRSVTVNGTSYARYRSTSFTPQTGATDYAVTLGNEAVGKGLLAARVVILQDSGTLTNTQTQIEMGNEETYTSTATSTFASPKYWLYDSSKWDGSPTFYAEVTYQTLVGVASTTAYTTAGTRTVVIPAATASTTVQLWGGGGAGGGVPATATREGGGGAGGQFAQSNFVFAPTQSYTMIVGNTAAGVSNANGTVGSDSTFATTRVVAKGGAAGLSSTNGGTAGTGSTASGVGDLVFAGGSGSAGGNQVCTALGGSGGGGAGTTGAGGNASGQTAGTGTTLSGGAGGASSGSATGATGSVGTGAGGGGGGACNGSAATARLGGTGAIGRGSITNYLATTTISLQESDGTGDGFQNFTTKVTIVGNGTAATSTRVRSIAFTPTNGRNYRIAFANGKTGAVYAIYNAKIVVDQTSPTLLEPQYLLANTRFAAGTSLQNFLTYWDPAEWTGTNVFKHEAGSVVAGTSDVKLQNVSGPTDITGSTVTDVIQREQSSAMTMPGAAATLDVVATSNSNNLYVSRILAQINLATVPDAPTSLVATGGGGSIGLTWTAPVSDGGSTITNYKIYRDTTSSPTTLLTTIGNTTSYSDSTAVVGTTYYYRVKATNSIGDSAYSNESSASASGGASAQRASAGIRGGLIKLIGGRILLR